MAIVRRNRSSLSNMSHRFPLSVQRAMDRFSQTFDDSMATVCNAIKNARRCAQFRTESSNRLQTIDAARYPRWFMNPLGNANFFFYIYFSPRITIAPDNIRISTEEGFATPDCYLNAEIVGFLGRSWRIFTAEVGRKLCHIEVERRWTISSIRTAPTWSSNISALNYSNCSTTISSSFLV